MNDLENRGNGHGPPVFKPEDFGNDYLRPDVANAISTLTKPGDEPKELIMRGHYWTSDYGTAWCCLLDLAQHFHDEQLEKLLMNIVAKDTAVEGYRIEKTVEAIIGNYNPTGQKKSAMSKARQFLGMGESNKEDGK